MRDEKYLLECASAQRRNVVAAEDARRAVIRRHLAFAAAHEAGWSLREIAGATGLTATTVARALRD